MAYVMDSPAQPVEDLGVTRLADTCEHVFCRKELSTLVLVYLPYTLLRSLLTTHCSTVF